MSPEYRKRPDLLDDNITLSCLKVKADLDLTLTG